MLKLEDKKNKLKGSIWLVVLGLLIFSACTSKKVDKEVDKLNYISYTFHYKDLDSTFYYASRALNLADKYPSGQAEAYNNLAFVKIAKMDYKGATDLLSNVYKITNNQIELLISDVQNMRLCQRRAHNKEFYDYMESAQSRIHRIEEEPFSLNDREKDRFIYAKTEFSIVSSTYYYYVGLSNQSSKAILEINPYGEILNDTAQYMNYLYQIGSGGIITNKSPKATTLEEFSCLINCYMISRQTGSIYWQANSLQAISEMLLYKEQRDWISKENPLALAFLNEDEMQEDVFCGYLAKKSLDLFTSYGDVYQIAGAYRTLAYCYWELGDYSSALICLEDALSSRAINQTPDLVASIREVMSLVYSAQDNKKESDINRNIYLDLQEQTRQDRLLEARAEQLEKTLVELNVMIVFIIVFIILVVSLFIASFLKARKNKKEESIENLLVPLHQWQASNDEYINSLQDNQDEIKESLSTLKLHLEASKRRFIDNKAKINLAVSVMPYIDRILNEINKISTLNEDKETQRKRYKYVEEIVDQINSYNDVLTSWIKLQQGQLVLHIESFPLNDLFSILEKSKMSFSLKNITFNVVPTNLVVKADKILTLFMLNTLADNARKFTPNGGEVTISAQEKEDYVEISIKDTGIGMTKEEIDNIFERKVYDSHGFGLLNCRGIMDRYKKVSHIFSACGLFVQSEKQKGSRFYFRLPKGVIHLILLLLGIFTSLLPLKAYSSDMTSNNDDILSLDLEKAGIYADSAYYSNISKNYLQTLNFADSAIYYLNRHYKSIYPKGKDLMLLYSQIANRPSEMIWFEKKLQTNYDIILDVRNEVAVAALALKNWNLYKYNNRAYTQLFKDKSLDFSLASYCQTMIASTSNKSVAIVLLVVLLITILIVYYFLYYRKVLNFRHYMEEVENINKVLLSNESLNNKLERISLVDTRDYPELLKDIVQRIKSVLMRSLELDETQRLKVELAQDELSRLNYEDERFYVTNNVIDNSLSTLKHETMYYPSRIKQIIEDSKKNIKVLGEVASYYKQLYSILSEQIEHHTTRVTFESKLISLDKEFNLPYYVLADKVLLKYLFDILKKHFKVNKEDIKLEIEDEKTICFDMEIALKSSQDFFTPKQENIPLLICRQIVREIGELANNHTSGIEIIPLKDESLRLRIVLPGGSSLEK